MPQCLTVFARAARNFHNPFTHHSMNPTEPTTEPIPPADPHRFDKPLLWREERDADGNSTFEALSMTYGTPITEAKPEPEPCYDWRVRCVLLGNMARWSVEGTDGIIAENAGLVALYESAAEARDECQRAENELRNKLGEGLPLPPLPEPEERPLVADEHGFAPTTRVIVQWSPKQGSLRARRVWRRVEPPHMEQEREIDEAAEEAAAFAGYFTQQMIEELVTRLCTGGFGRMVWQTPFATVMMQCELDFLKVSAFTAQIRRGGKMTELAVNAPTTDRIMQVVARQMAERKRQLDESIGNSSVRELQEEIVRNARLLGLPAEMPRSPQAETGSGVLPVTLEDIQAAGGDITKRAGGLS